MRKLRMISTIAVFLMAAPHLAAAQEADNSTAKAVIVGGVLLGGAALAIAEHNHHKHRRHDDAPRIPLAPGPVKPQHQIGNGAAPIRQPVPTIGGGVIPSPPYGIGQGVTPNQRLPFHRPRPHSYNPYN